MTEDSKRKVQEGTGQHPKNNVCAVCFSKTKRHLHDKNFDLITCQKCNLQCHRGCYDQTIPSSHFLCDVCRSFSENSRNQYQVVCFFCQNPGLLKQIGNNKYSHPLCLLLYGKIDKVSYITLQSHVQDYQLLNRRPITESCQLCHRSTPYIQQCQETKCGRKAHFFCALKNSQQYEDSWNTLLQIKSSYYQSDKEAKKQRKRITCNRHSIYCICKKVKNQDFVCCDQCLRWYHYSCVGVQSTNLGQQYFCSFCRQFQALNKDSRSDIRVYPKLHFYDFMRILRIYETSRSYKMLGIIKKFPMYCSLNFYKDTKQYDMNSKIEDLMMSMAVSKSVNNSECVYIDQNFVQFVIRKYKLQSRSFKLGFFNDDRQSEAKSHQLRPITVVEFFNLIKQIPKRQLSKTDPLSKFIEFNLNSRNYYYNLDLIIKYILIKIKKQIDFKGYNLFQEFIEIIRNAQERCNMNVLDELNSQQITKSRSLLGFVNMKINEKVKKQYFDTYRFIGQLEEMKSKNMGCEQLIQEFQKFKKTSSPNLFFQGLKDMIDEKIRQHFCYLQDLKRLQQKEILNKQSSMANRISIPFSQYEKYRSESTGIDNLEGQYFQIKTIKIELDRLIFEQPNERSIAKIEKFFNEFQQRLILKLPKEDIQKYRGYVSQYNVVHQIVEIISKMCSDQLRVQKPQGYKGMIQYLRKYVKSTLNNQNKGEYIPLIRLTTIIQNITSVSIIHPHVQEILCAVYSLSLIFANIDEVQARSLQHIVECIDYLKVQVDITNQIKNKQFRYRVWASVYIRSLNFLNLQMYFQDSKPIPSLLQKIKQAFANTPFGMNVDKDLKLLNMIEMWCCITQKLHISFFNTKPTPTSVMQMMKIVIQSNYPTHISPYSKIYKLNTECIEVQNKINICLSQILNIENQIDVTKQLEVVDKKIRLQQIPDLIRKLESSKINWCLEIKMLNNEIEYYKNKVLEAQKLEQQYDFKLAQELFIYFLYESPFYFHKFNQLRNLMRSHLCKLIPLTKKNFDKLIKWGGPEIKYLQQLCANQIKAHKFIENLQEAITLKVMIGFPSLQQILTILNNLFPKDPKRNLILNWVNQFYKLENKVHQMINSNLNRSNFQNCYEISTLQDWLKEYNNIPIASESKCHIFRRLEVYYSLVFCLKQIKYDEWLNTEEPSVLSDKHMFQLIDIVKCIREHNLLLKQYEKSFVSFQNYMCLISIIPEGHAQYLLYLKQCHKLSKRFLKSQFLLHRLNSFLQNNKFIRKCFNYEESQIYFDEWKILFSSHVRTQLIENVSKIEEFFLNDSSKQRLVPIEGNYRKQQMTQELKESPNQYQNMAIDQESDVQIIGENPVSKGEDIKEQEQIIDSDFDIVINN